MAKRKEVRCFLNDDDNYGEPTSNGKLTFCRRDKPTSNVELTFCRQGVEVSGYYDNMVGIGNTKLIPWDEIDRYRAEVNKKGG